MNNLYKKIFSVGGILVFSILGFFLSVFLIFIGEFIAAITVLIFSLIIAIIIWRVKKSIKETEALIKVASAGTDKLADISSDAVLTYDNNFRVTGFNKVSETLFNLKKEDIVGKIISPALIGDEKFSVITQVIFPSLSPSVIKRSDPGEYPQVTDIDFMEPELHLTTRTERIVKDSTPVGFVKSIENRTREIELIHSKSEFITVAAHQLRTPLTAVHWTFETLEKSITGPDKELIDNGLEVSVNLLKIVTDLLDASKIESGKFGYDFKETDLVSFIDGLLKNANLLAKKFEVSVYFDKPSEPINISIDPNKLGLALSNIIDNGIKYNVKNGNITVKLEKMTDKPFIVLTIKDTGIGVPKNDLKRLFTKFYRGENVVKEQTDGTGLGLYISRNIIVRHGGTIAVDSTLGRGTIFTITLPTDSSLIPPSEMTIE